MLLVLIAPALSPGYDLSKALAHVRGRAYVFTNDLTIAWKMAEGLEAGIIGVNDPVPATPQCPFGGMKESGMGRELGHEGMEAYLETKYVSFKLRD